MTAAEKETLFILQFLQNEVGRYYYIARGSKSGEGLFIKGSIDYDIGLKWGKLNCHQF